MDGCIGHSCVVYLPFLFMVEPQFREDIRHNIYRHSLWVSFVHAWSIIVGPFQNIPTVQYYVLYFMTVTFTVQYSTVFFNERRKYSMYATAESVLK